MVVLALAACLLAACDEDPGASTAGGSASSTSSELVPSTPTTGPSTAATPYPTAIGGPQDVVEVHLGNVSSGHRKPGHQLVFGQWGQAPDQFGISEEVGPTSFDVTPDGRLVIADEKDHRLAVITDGNRTNLRVGLQPVFVDLAVTDRAANVLVINGGRAGNDLLKRFAFDGSPLGTSVLGGSVDNVRIFNGQLFAYHGEHAPRTPSGWVAVDTPSASSGGGVPTRTGGQVSLSGGRGHHVTITRTEASSTRAWTLTSDMNLGVFEVAPTRSGVQAVLVHWTNTQRVFQYVDLTKRGLAAQFTLPDDHYAEMTAGSTFRFRGDTLYRAASTPAGFGVYAYPLHVTNNHVTPSASSNVNLLRRAVRLLASAGVRDAGESEPPHGSPSESLWGHWRGRQVTAGVVPTEFATPPQHVVRSYDVSGTTVTVLRSAPYVVHQFVVGDDTWTVVCSTVDGAQSDDAATTRFVHALISAGSS